MDAERSAALGAAYNRLVARANMLGFEVVLGTPEDMRTGMGEEFVGQCRPAWGAPGRILLSATLDPEELVWVGAHEVGPAEQWHDGSYMARFSGDPWAWYAGEADAHARAERMGRELDLGISEDGWRRYAVRNLDAYVDHLGLEEYGRS